MSTQAVTLQLPLSVYEFYKSRAQRARRSVEGELLELVATAVEDLEALPSDLAEAVAGLAVLDDEALWRAARSRLSSEQQEELEALSFKQQSEGLLPEEHERQAQLLRTGDRVMLVRAHAAKLLQERGHDISVLHHS